MHSLKKKLAEFSETCNLAQSDSEAKLAAVKHQHEIKISVMEQKLQCCSEIASQTVSEQLFSRLTSRVSEWSKRWQLGPIALPISVDLTMDGLEKRLACIFDIVWNKHAQIVHEVSFIVT